MFRFTKTTAARDMLISQATKIPKNLRLAAVDEEVQFTKTFLLSLNDEQLSNLRKEAEKQGNKDIFLFFYTIPEEKVAKETPCEVRNFSSFDFSKVVSIGFNGNTAPFLPYVDAPPVHYVSVILATKN